MIEALATTYRIDSRAESAVQRATYQFLAELTEATAVCCEEEIDAGTFMPVISSETLREWLLQTVDVTEAAKETPSINAQLSLAVQREVLSYISSALQLDSTLSKLFRGTGSTVSSTAMHVNIPFVEEALQDHDIQPGRVYLVAVPEFYEASPTDDGRIDVILGATLWNGALLCRPVLTDLEKAREVVDAPFRGVLAGKPAPVAYTPKYGHH